MFTALTMNSLPANALIIDPTYTPQSTTVLSSNLGACTSINAAFGTSLNCTSLELQYKVSFGDADSGPAATWYDTVFGEFAEEGPPSEDPSGAVISWVGSSKINCPACYLIVKDGNNQPAQYLFDISDTWNGTDTINIAGLWPGSVRGAISNVAIWASNGTDSVPAPMPLTLISLGAFLLGLGLVRQAQNT
jgi:hypothetical protein